MHTRKYVKLLLIGGSVVGLDQLTKSVILNHVALYDSISVIPGFFNITHIHNPGGAFGFLSGAGSGLRSLVFILVSSLAIGLIFWYYRKTPDTHPWLAAALALVFGGALGNLIDRLRFGKVVDFLDFHIDRWHWPAFNIADSAISVGIAIFVLHLLFKRMPE